MVKQGDIIKISFDPQKGHEQAGFRPAIVVSNNFFNSRSNIILVCPITNTNNAFPLHVFLNGRTQTTGVVLCEHVRGLDISARGFKFVEAVPEDVLDEVIEKLSSIIEPYNS